MQIKKKKKISQIGKYSPYWGKKEENWQYTDENINPNFHNNTLT